MSRRRPFKSRQPGEPPPPGPQRAAGHLGLSGSTIAVGPALLLGEPEWGSDAWCGGGRHGAQLFPGGSGGGCGRARGCRGCCYCCCCPRRSGAAPRTAAGSRSRSPSAVRCNPSICSTPAAWLPTTAATTSVRCVTWKARCAATGACETSARAVPATARRAARSHPPAPAPEPSCPSSERCSSGRAAPAAARDSAWAAPCPGTASARTCAATSSAECPTTTCSGPTSRY